MMEHTMAKHRLLLPVLALITTVAIIGSITSARAGEIRGSVSKVESGGRVQISLPAGAVVQPGAQVRIETVVPGIGPVEIKSHWRVKLVGEDFVIADPEGEPSGTPQVGYVATVTTSVGVTGRDITGAVPSVEPNTTFPSLPALRLRAEQVTELQNQAERGEVSAMLALAHYHEGPAIPSDSVPRSVDEGIRWYEKAAEKGDAAAMQSLGHLYQLRRNDGQSAAMWFRKAADKGNAAAMLALGQLYTDKGGLPTNEAQAFEWIKKAAESGNVTAAADVGARYVTGRGTRQNHGEAAYWFRRAAENGNAAGMAALADMYVSGKGVAKDANKAFEWAMKAAQAGTSWGTYQLGSYYHRGIGTTANAAEALRWYELAAQKGQADAMFGLSLLYANGQGVAADPRTAADWMIQAIGGGSIQAAESLMKTPGKWTPAFRKEVQQQLRSAGVYTGAINGKMDEKTGRAVAELSRRALAQ